MKVVVLNGSPRKKGNTAEILKTVEREMISLGHEFEEIFLASKTINGCLACGKCKEVNDAIGCVQKDDAPMILQKMIDADSIIYASPVYFWGFSAHLKAVIDRTYSLYNYYHTPEHISLLENKRFGLLVTGGGGYDQNAELLSIAYKNILGCYKSENGGELFIGKCTSPEHFADDVKDKAAAFAAGLIS